MSVQISTIFEDQNTKFENVQCEQFLSVYKQLVLEICTEICTHKPHNISFKIFLLCEISAYYY